SVFIFSLAATVAFRFSLVFLAVLSERRSTLRRFYESARHQVADVLREIINDRWAEDVMWGAEFDSVSAPTMVGVGIDNAVSSTTYVELSSFISEHSTSAVGIAGARGIGKSTLMDQLRFDKGLDCICVRLSAPQRYDSAALIRLIHRSVAAEVLWP